MIDPGKAIVLIFAVLFMMVLVEFLIKLKEIL